MAASNKKLSYIIQYNWYTKEHGNNKSFWQTSSINNYTCLVIGRPVKDRKIKQDKHNLGWPSTIWPEFEDDKKEKRKKKKDGSKFRIISTEMIRKPGDEQKNE